MIRINLLFFISLLTGSCHQIETHHVSEQLNYDTSKIAIIHLDKQYSNQFDAAKNYELSNYDLKIIDSVLTESVNTHNSGIDTATQKWDYIDFSTHRRQYVPFITSKGEKKVYVNCFCGDFSAFDYWKEKIVEVDDGGSCFFNATINLSSGECENLFVNGPG